MMRALWSSTASRHGKLYMNLKITTLHAKKCSAKILYFTDHDLIIWNAQHLACSRLFISGEDRKNRQATSKVWYRKWRAQGKETTPPSFPDPTCPPFFATRPRLSLSMLSITAPLTQSLEPLFLGIPLVLSLTLLVAHPHCLVIIPTDWEPGAGYMYIKPISYISNTYSWHCGSFFSVVSIFPCPPLTAPVSPRMLYYLFCT